MSSTEVDAHLFSIVKNFQKQHFPNAPPIKVRNYRNFDLLMPRRVRNICLVSSLYDSFTFEEDCGKLSESLFSQYTALKLTVAPRIVRVSTGMEAIQKIEAGESFDLIIWILRLESGIVEFLQSVIKHSQRLPVLFLATNVRELATMDSRVDHAYRFNVQKTTWWERGFTDIQNMMTWPFLWQGDSGLILAMVKTVEDRLNARHDVTFGDVRVIIIVEDNVKFYSSFLPTLYREVMKLTQQVVLQDTVNDFQRLRCMRARPKILLANSYEEGEELYIKFKENLLGVITDVGYPRNGVHDEKAGLSFAQMIRAEKPYIPILVQSVDQSNAAVAAQLNASFINKTDSQLIKHVQRFLLKELGFGPFIFNQQPVVVAKNVREFIETLHKVSQETLLFHLQRGHFATWLNARTEFALAKAVKHMNTDSFQNFGLFKATFISLVKAHLFVSRSGGISDFNENTFDGDANFVRIGTGSLGGKGRSLAFFNSLLDRHRVPDVFPTIRFFIPNTLILATEVFDLFMEENGLSDVALSQKISNEDVISKFLNAKLNDKYVSYLKIYLTYVKVPIAVRSSGLSEDAIQKPYAGIYSTFILPNNKADDVRFEELLRAVKLVYASTFLKEAQSYALASGNRPEEEKMAILIQQLVGKQQEDRYFYPSMAGVARSYDFYPKDGLDPTGGVCFLALGLGGFVVDGGQCVRFSPANPQLSYLHVDQDKLLALDFAKTAPPSNNIVGYLGSTIYDKHLVYKNIEGSNKNYQFRVCVPSEVKNDRTHPPMARRDSIRLEDVHGNFVEVTQPFESPRIPKGTEFNEETLKLSNYTLEGLIKSECFPLAKLISLLLLVAKEGMSCPVEMEFAINIPNQTENDEEGKWKIEFALLQVRPTVTILKDTHIGVDLLPSEDYVICSTYQALGHGRFNGIKDIIFVSPDDFDINQTVEIAKQIGEVNEKINKRPYILIGPGRWGTATFTKGIPVNWNDISGAQCIVESDLGGSEFIPPSQGTHFFQNITSFGIAYFTVNSQLPGSFVNFEWLNSQSDVVKHGFVKHLQFSEELEVVVDGRTRCGVIMKPPHNFEVVVAQMNSFLALDSIECA